MLTKTKLHINEQQAYVIIRKDKEIDGMLEKGTGNLMQKAASGRITTANIDIWKGFMWQDKNRDIVFAAKLSRMQFF